MSNTTFNLRANFNNGERYDENSILTADEMNDLVDNTMHLNERITTATDRGVIVAGAGDNNRSNLQNIGPGESTQVLRGGSAASNPSWRNITGANSLRSDMGLGTGSGPVGVNQVLAGPATGSSESAPAWRTLTAAQVGASASNHTHTAAQVGAAPVGHTHATANLITASPVPVHEFPTTGSSNNHPVQSIVIGNIRIAYGSVRLNSDNNLTVNLGNNHRFHSAQSYTLVATVEGNGRSLWNPDNGTVVDRINGQSFRVNYGLNTNRDIRMNWIAIGTITQ